MATNTSPTMFSDSQAFEIELDGTTGKPVVKAGSEEQSFVKGLTNELTGLFNGGRTASVGLSHTAFAVAAQWAGATVRNAVYGDTKLRLNAWSAVGNG